MDGTYRIETDDEVDRYLNDMLKTPAYRSMGEIEKRAHELIDDLELRARFIQKGREKLDDDQ